MPEGNSETRESRPSVTRPAASELTSAEALALAKWLEGIESCINKKTDAWNEVLSSIDKRLAEIEGFIAIKREVRDTDPDVIGFA